VNCGGLSELAALWTDVARDARQQAGGQWQGRRYVPGYGLVSQRSLDEARAALRGMLDEAEVPLTLDDALACCRRAGITSPDAGLLLHLDVVVAHDGLFGEARVYRLGDDPARNEHVESPALPTPGPQKSRTAPARGHRTRTAPADEADTLAIGLFAIEPATVKGDLFLTH